MELAECELREVELARMNSSRTVLDCGEDQSRGSK